MPCAGSRSATIIERLDTPGRTWPPAGRVRGHIEPFPRTRCRGRRPLCAGEARYSSDRGAAQDAVWDSIDYFGDRWTQQVLAVFFFDAYRHEDIRAHTRCSTNLLADRLRLLLEHGLMQVYAAVTHGFAYARSVEFLQQPPMQTLVWMRMPGDIIFAVGAGLLALFVAKLYGRRARPLRASPYGTAGAPWRRLPFPRSGTRPLDRTTTHVSVLGWNRAHARTKRPHFSARVA